MAALAKSKSAFFISRTTALDLSDQLPLLLHSRCFPRNEHESSPIQELHRKVCYSYYVAMIINTIQTQKYASISKNTKNIPFSLINIKLDGTGENGHGVKKDDVRLESKQKKQAPTCFLSSRCPESFVPLLPDGPRAAARGSFWGRLRCGPTDISFADALPGDGPRKLQACRARSGYRGRI